MSSWNACKVSKNSTPKSARCAKLKAIIVANKERGDNDNPLVFPQLFSIELNQLENLKSFYGSCGPEEEKEESTKHELNVEILEPQPLFNQKVVFPCMEVMEIWSLGNIKEIWHSTPPTNSFNNLRHLPIHMSHSIPLPIHMRNL
ncbi:hypothetical protein ACSBR1_020881 [Camellia fascicularis]